MKSRVLRRMGTKLSSSNTMLGLLCSDLKMRTLRPIESKSIPFGCNPILTSWEVAILKFQAGLE